LSKHRKTGLILFVASVQLVQQWANSNTWPVNAF